MIFYILNKIFVNAFCSCYQFKTPNYLIYIFPAEDQLNENNLLAIMLFTFQFLNEMQNTFMFNNCKLTDWKEYKQLNSSELIIYFLNTCFLIGAF